MNKEDIIVANGKEYVDAVSLANYFRNIIDEFEQSSLTEQHIEGAK